jgi:hypothetical protein
LTVDSQLPLQHEPEDLPLTRTEPCISLVCPLHGRHLRAQLERPGDGARDSVVQGRGVHGLAQEVDGAQLHRGHARLDVVALRHEHDRGRGRPVADALPHVESRQRFRARVEDRAAGGVALRAFEESRTRREGLHAIAESRDQPGEFLARRTVVVDDGDGVVGMHLRGTWRESVK